MTKEELLEAFNTFLGIAIETFCEELELDESAKEFLAASYLTEKTTEESQSTTEKIVSEQKDLNEQIAERQKQVRDARMERYLRALGS